MGTETQIETVRTPSDDPRFMLEVEGVKVRVTRLGITDEGESHFEIAECVEGRLRDVFPGDRGYVLHGGVWARTMDWDEEAEEWTNISWELVGEVESCRLCVGNSVKASLAEPVV